MKKITFYLLLTFIIPNSVLALAQVPPSSCDRYYPHTRFIGNTFEAKSMLYTYKKGLLKISFKYSAPNTDRTFNLTGSLLKNDNCDFLDSINSLPIEIPVGVSDISIRFLNDYSFEVYNDTTNAPLTCENCKVSFIPPSPEPYKFLFNLNTDFNNHYVESHPISIQNPNQTPQKTPVLIIPGSLSTDILKDGEKLWLDIKKLLLTNNDRFMDPLGFNEQAMPIDTSLTLGDVLKNPDNEFDYSQSLIDEFAKQNYEENTDLFLFPYDWRKHISENANGPLKAKIDELILNSPDEKINVVAHSQGGLLIKRLLFEHPEYKSKINKLIFVGTPHLGAPKSFKVLTDGDQFGVKYLKVLGLDPEEIVRISKNMPSVYEMLPSKEYFNRYKGYWGELDRHIFKQNEEKYYNYEITKAKLKEKGFNKTLLDANDSFHAYEYDFFDFTDSEIDVHNIVGCQTPTYAGVIVKSLAKDKILWEPGDETVPIKSATNVVNVNSFYATESSHATMLTQEGIKEKIVNIISGSNLETKNITENISDCKFEGTEVSAHSPVDMHIYDELGRHTGPTPDGGFDSEIPNLGYEIIGHEKFAFLPDNSTYSVKLIATDNGHFDFYSSQVNEGKVVNTAYYDQIPITSNSTAQINLNTSNTQNISLDTNSDGIVDQSLAPSSILDEKKSQDLNSPKTLVSLQGTKGKQGFFRSDVKISLFGTDGNDNGSISDPFASNILKTNYKLNDQEWVSVSPTTTNFSQIKLNLISEGKHTLLVFSTDKAGNNEPLQTITFTIDKTPPEALLKYNQTTKQTEFLGIDNLSPQENLILQKDKNQTTISDEAGNTTKVFYTQYANRANITEISYNSGKTTPLFPAKMSIVAQTEKDVLKALFQNGKNKAGEQIYTFYPGKICSLNSQLSPNWVTQFLNGVLPCLNNPNYTGVIEKTNSGGWTFKQVEGLKTIHLQTEKGDVRWGE